MMFPPIGITVEIIKITPMSSKAKLLRSKELGNITMKNKIAFGLLKLTVIPAKKLCNMLLAESALFRLGMYWHTPADKYL